MSNTVHNLQKQSIATGFGFLKKEAAFEIGESVIPYSAANTYARALLVGALNTIKVSFVGIVITLLLGTVIGVARLSSNWLVARLSAIYIEVMQDLPVLLQLVFWYAIFYESLPSPREALYPGAGIYLCNRGVAFTIPEAHPAHLYMFLAFLAGCVATHFIRQWAKKRQEKTGLYFPVFRVSLALILGLPLAVWLIAGAPMKMNVPKEKLEGVIRLLPSLNAPTVANLYNTDWVSVESVVDLKIVRELIPRLIKGGAEGIIEYPLNKVI